MKMRVLSKLKSHVVCALAAGLVLSMQVSCGSSSDGETEQEIGLEAETNAEGQEGEPLNNAEEVVNDGGELLNDANNLESADSGDASLNEGVNNFDAGAMAEPAPVNETAEMINQGAGDANEMPSSDPALAAAAGSDPFAANSTESDPFAAPVNTEASSPAVAMPEAAAPVADSAPMSSQPEVTLSSPSQGYVPEDGARMAYIIQVGDTMAGISRKIFGNSNNWRTLAEENNIANPGLIYAGDVIYYSLNAKSRSFAQSYETAPRKAVTVKAGDSLSSIAEQVYGSQGSWRSLWKENPQVSNPDQLTVGMVLTYRSASGMASVDMPSEEDVTQVVSMTTMDAVVQD